jgi:dTDP-4-dehydrorhamnose reductase
MKSFMAVSFLSRRIARFAFRRRYGSTELLQGNRTVPTERCLITGASGQLGGHVIRQLAESDGLHGLLALAGRGDVGTPGVEVRRVDLRDANALRACVAEYRPTHVVHLGAMTAVTDAFAHPQEAELVNTAATRVLAEAAAAAGARFLFSSTDMVFDGTAAPYRETDQPNPLSQYGRTKVAAERLLVSRPDVLVVRLPLMYGFAATPRSTTFANQIGALRRGETVRLFTDEFRTPIWLPDAARAVIALARSGCNGLVHVAGPERLSRYELVAACAKRLGIGNPKLEPISRLSIAAPEPRPADLSLHYALFRSMFPSLAPKPISEAALEMTSR